MYDDLIKRLRTECILPYATLKLMHEAADAIEELRKAVLRLEDESGIYDELPTFYIYPTKWIPVTERCPENQRPVLVYVPPYTDEEEEYIEYVGMAYYTSSMRGGYWCGTDGNVYGAIGMIHEPMAWMPLPEPPEREGE